MKRLLHSVVSLTLVVLLNVFSVGAHASTLSSASMHNMSGMKHSSTSLNCVTLCAGVTSYKGNELGAIDEEDDDSPQPFYVNVLQTLAAIEKQHTENTRIVVRFEPPPGSPAYIQLSVFRA